MEGHCPLRTRANEYQLGLFISVGCGDEEAGPPMDGLRVSTALRIPLMRRLQISALHLAVSVAAQH